MTPDEYHLACELVNDSLDASSDRAKSTVAARINSLAPELRGEVLEMVAQAVLAESKPFAPLLMSLSDLPEDLNDDGSGHDEHDALIGVTIGRYRILRLLSVGGMGKVYVAEQKDLQRHVAIKVLRRHAMDTSTWKRFELEIRILAHLQHPGIAQIIESGTYTHEKRKYPYYAMELVPNARTIFQYAEDHKLDTTDRLRLMIKVCEAIHEGHLKGIMHRDLKPDNILVDPNGQPKVIDFGVAKVTNSDIAVVTMAGTSVGQLVGTLSYMSPEQCSTKDADIDQRSDVYALGVIMYELLSGHSPYAIKNSMIHEAVRVIQEDEPTRITRVTRGLPSDVSTIVHKAMAKEKGHRYQSAANVAADIQRYFRNEPIRGRPPRTWYVFRKFVQRERLSVAISLSVLLLAMLAAAWGWNRLEAARHDDAFLRFRDCLAAFQGVAVSLRENKYSEANLDAYDDLSRVINRQTVGDPATRSLLLKQAAQLFGAAGQYDLAVRFHDLELSGWVELEGPWGSNAIVAEMLLASALRDNGHLERSYEVARLAIQEDDMLSAHYLNRFAYVMAEAKHDMGRRAASRNQLQEASQYFEAAEKTYRETLENQLSNAPLAETDILDSKGSLGILLSDQGEHLDEAILLLEESLQGRLADEYGSDSSAAWMHDYLGQAFLKAGRLQEAVDQLQRAVDLRVSVYNSFHPLTLQSKNNLGKALIASGQAARGLEYLRLAAEESDKCLRPEHWRRIAFQKDYEEAVDR